jgi:hypothetical protein
VEGLTKISEFKTLYKIPDHVLSIKFLDDYKRNQEFNEAEPTNPPRKVMEAILSQSTAQGENPVEIINVMNADLLMEEIGRVKENLRTLDAQDGKATAILRALRRLEEELNNEAPRKRGLKKKGKPKTAEIDTSNIINPERTESIPWRLTDSETAVAESSERRMVKRKLRRSSEKEEPSETKVIGVGYKSRS